MSLNHFRNFHCCKSLSASFKSPSSHLKEFLFGQKIRKYEVVRPGNVTLQKRIVPSHIRKPSYFATGIPTSVPFQIPEAKDQSAIEGVRHASFLAKRVLEEVGKEAKVGVTTDELDAFAHHLIIDADAYPSPLNYKGFPKSICTSVNNVCCHGIPDDRPLEDGDIVNIDVTVYLGGYHGDCSKTFLVGTVDEEGKKLVEVSELCLSKAIEACGPNVPFSIIGHGIGSYFHGPPEIYHVCNSYGGKMKPGNTFTIEPAITSGGQQLEILEDGWTVVTADCARSAQCEHTVLITDVGVEVLTELH
ncbi:methionine aminopeptidase 1D, mitochondrial isoform X2 [Thrips palmi]|uniref:Methionine aminopeptidase 1D, mitochondrial isoform X2 n=1 Tax=Thrips palmi TaxID=161013 RepID=A0A6P8YWN6_THRPL|nr:methionine aminopeptidase 1D, mitochondrial isoform X2 [Thrips palmi]